MKWSAGPRHVMSIHARRTHKHVEHVEDKVWHGGADRVFRCCATGWKAGLETMHAAAHSAQGHASVHVAQQRQSLAAMSTEQPSTMRTTEYIQLFLYLSGRHHLLHVEAPKLSTKLIAGWHWNLSTRDSSSDIASMMEQFNSHAPEQLPR